MCTLTGHTDCVNWLDSSPVGTHIASASDDNLVKIWDVESGAEVRSLGGVRSVW